MQGKNWTKKITMKLQAEQAIISFYVCLQGKAIYF